MITPSDKLFDVCMGLATAIGATHDQLEKMIPTDQESRAKNCEVEEELIRNLKVAEASLLSFAARTMAGLESASPSAKLRRKQDLN